MHKAGVAVAPGTFVTYADHGAGRTYHGRLVHACMSLG